MRRAPARPAPLPADPDRLFRLVADLQLLAVYAQDEWNLTPQWSVYTGLRWEGLETTIEGDKLERVRQRSMV